MRTALQRSGSWIKRHFVPLCLILTAPGVAWALWGQRHSLSDFQWHFTPWLLVLALILAALGPVAQAVSYHQALHAFEVPAPMREVLVVWTRSFLLRYSPGGALTYVYRVRQAGRVSAERNEVLAASAYEQFAVVQACLTFAMLCLIASGRNPPLALLALFAVGTGIMIVARPELLGDKVQALLQRRKIEIPELPSLRDNLKIVGWNLLGCLAVALSNWLVLRGLSSEANIGFLQLSGLYAFAFAVGTLIPSLPGGLGTREAMVVLLLAPALSAGPATALALSFRLVATLAEFAAIGLSELAYVLGVGVRERRANTPSPGLAPLASPEELQVLTQAEQNPEPAPADHPEPDPEPDPAEQGPPDQAQPNGQPASESEPGPAEPENPEPGQPNPKPKRKRRR